MSQLTLENVYVKALDNYSAAVALHRPDYAKFTPRDRGKRTGGFCECVCGHVAKNANGLGLHVAAAERRASRAYENEAAAAWRAYMAQGRVTA